MTTLEQLKKEAIEKFNVFIKDWTEHNYSHLIDTDDNDGQFFRDFLDSFAAKCFLAGEMAGIENAIKALPERSVRHEDPHFKDENVGYQTCRLETRKRLEALLSQDVV